MVIAIMLAAVLLDLPVVVDDELFLLAVHKRVLHIHCDL